MPQELAYEQYEIVAGGGTKNFATNVDTNGYYIFTNGAVTLAGNVTITDDGSGIQGMLFKIFYAGNVTLGAFNVSIFGYNLSQAQATNGCKIEAFNIGGAYVVYVDGNLNGTGQVQTADLADEAVTPAKMSDLTMGNIYVGDASNRPVELDISADGAVPFGQGGGAVAANVITGDVDVDKTGASAIAANVIIDGDISDTAGVQVKKFEAMSNGQVIVGDTGSGNIAKVVTMSSDVLISNTGATTIQAASVTPEKSSTNLSDDEISVDVSFAAGSVGGNFTTIAPCNGTILSIAGTVTFLIEATNNGTVTPNIGGVPVTGGLVTFTGGDVLNTDRAGTSVTAANTFTAGQEINLVTAKVTAGGTARMTIKYRRTS